MDLGYTLKRLAGNAGEGVTMPHDGGTKVTFDRCRVVFFSACCRYCASLSASAGSPLPLAAQDFKDFFTGREDFLRAYSVSELIAAGHPEKVYDTDAYIHAFGAHTPVNAATTGWLYPPIYLPAVHMLAYMSYKTAFAVWLLAQAALFFAVSYRFLWFRPYEALVLWSPPLALALSWDKMAC